MNPALRQGGQAAALVAALAIAGPVVQKVEGRRLDPYYDIARVLTVCYGETVNIQNRRHTPAECTAMLDASLPKYGRAVQTCLPSWTPVYTLAAFIVFAYNVGSSAACGSTAAKRVRAGNVAGGCDALTMWNKVTNPITGKLVVSRGLDNRRAVERDLCRMGLFNV